MAIHADQSSPYPLNTVGRESVERQKVFNVRGEPRGEQSGLAEVYQSDRLDRPNGFVRHHKCSGFAGFCVAGDWEFCSIQRRLSRECVQGDTPPGHVPLNYFFLAGAGGAAPVSWWKTATHLPFRSVQTVEAYVVPGNG